MVHGDRSAKNYGKIFENYILIIFRVLLIRKGIGRENYDEIFGILWKISKNRLCIPA